MGIDVSKFKHNCYLADEDNFDKGCHFEIKNSKEGFDYLLDKLSEFDKDKIRIGLESTGHYHLNLSRFLLDLNFNIHFFNPYQTSLYRKADSFRNTKTDKVDAFFIAKLLRATDSNPTHNELYHNYELKSLTRYKSSLKNDRIKLKNAIVGYLDLIFPELAKVCRDVFCKYTLEVLKEYPSADKIGQANLTKLTNLIKKASNGSHSKERAIEIREAARKSIGINSPAVSFRLVQDIKALEFLIDQIEEVNEQIKLLLDEMDNPIMTIPGVGIEIGPSLIAEIGNIDKFESPNKLLAYAGLDPSINQSGTMNSSYSCMSKRGSSYLRDALFLAAFLIYQNDEVFRLYYEKKKDEGKHHYVALTHVARKLTRVIFHLLKTNQKFLSQST
ncbi:TPA: IS110 family transposase [Streptococcus agalactiae]